MSSRQNWKNVLLWILLVGVNAWAAADPLPFPASVNTSASPSAVSFGGLTSVFYKGEDTDQGIYVTSSYSLLGPWGDAARLPLAIETSAAPSAVVQGGTLYVVYKGAGSDPGIYVARLDSDTAAWSMTKFPDSVNTSTGPNAYMSGGVLYVIYKGAGSDPRIFVMPLPADTTWQFLPIPDL